MEKAVTQWAVDPDHSKVQFKIRHLAIANVAGTFKVFSGEVETDNESFEGASIAFTIDATSINTDHEIRDGHLKSDMFFDTAKFPAITFTGHLDKKTESYEIEGDLTIRDIKKNIKLATEFNGTGKDITFQNTRAGFEASGTINRKDFGISFNAITEAGGLNIGEEVKLVFDIELIKLPVNRIPIPGAFEASVARAKA
jgi:polyisoprenoid-binding protein YceI